MHLMIRRRNHSHKTFLTVLVTAFCIGLAGSGRSDTLPPEVGRSVGRWWHAEGRSGRPTTRVDLVSRAGRRFLQVTIDEPDYRGATGNETYLLYLQERGRWRRLFSAIGLGYFVRRGAPGGHPWIETYAHDSAAVAVYQLWGWDNRKRAYAVRKEWEGPYPEAMQFVLPPGGLSRMIRLTPAGGSRRAH
jgi:hypothetical protein